MPLGPRKPVTFGRVLDQVVDVVVHLQLGEDVAGHELALGLDLLAALDLGHRLGRNLDRLDERVEAQARGLAMIASRTLFSKPE